MESSEVYVLISAVVLAIVAVLVFLVRNDTEANRLTPLASTAFAFSHVVLPVIPASAPPVPTSPAP